MKTKKLKPLLDAIESKSVLPHAYRARHLAHTYVLRTPYRHAEPVTEMDKMGKSAREYHLRNLGNSILQIIGQAMADATASGAILPILAVSREEIWAWLNEPETAEHIVKRSHKRVVWYEKQRRLRAASPFAKKAAG